MNIKELNSVVAVYQYKSFAEAAYQTSFSISAVSKHVQHVENELGIQLFRRKNYKNNKLLTPEGERLMPYILQLTDLSRCLEQMAEELRSQSETLTVGGIELMSGGVIDKILADFSMKYPDVTVENNYMHLREITHGIDTMELDCSLLLLNRDSPDSLIEAIRQGSSEELRIRMGHSETQLQIALRSSHPLAWRESVSLRDLADETFLLDLDAAQFPESVLSITHLIGRSFDQIRKKYIDSKRQNMVLAIVAAGGGVFPRSDMQTVEFPGVTFRPVKGAPTDVTFLFVSNPRNTGSNFRKFQKFIETEFDLEEM